MHFCRKRKIAKRDFRLENFGAKSKGANLLTRIGFTKVYKEVRPDKRYSPEEKAEIINDTILGHNFLRDSGLPVGNEHGRVVIRGKERLVFDKERNIKSEELNSRFKEIFSIIKEANRKGVYFDASPNNFGVDITGRIVIRDTNTTCAVKGERALKAMLRDLEANLNPRNAYHREVLKKLRKEREKLMLVK
jgi:hypothetical protein